MSDQNLFADQLTIETPEQVDLQFPIAGIGSRFIAMLLDQVILLVFYIVLGIIIYVTALYKTIDSTMDKQSDTAQKWLVALMILVFFGVRWGYFVLFEALWNGQTPGKHWMNLRVLKDSGRSITLFESMARNLLRIVDSIPTFYAVGIVAMLCNKANKRLGDFTAGTIVVHENTNEQPLLTHTQQDFLFSPNAPADTTQRRTPQAQADWAAAEAALPADAVARLKPADLHVIETFFNRALDLSVERRAELGSQVAHTMATRMGVSIPPGMQPERMLELIAHRMRSQGRF